MDIIQSLKGVQTIKIHFDEIVFVSEKKGRFGDLYGRPVWETGRLVPFPGESRII